MDGSRISVAVILCACVFGSAIAANWGYTGTNGPAYWKNSYLTCAGERQSPINIYEGDVVKNAITQPFNLISYDTANLVTWTIKNNGHSATVNIGGDTSILANGGGLDGEYRVAQFHFHWGSVDAQGSEHQISSHEYPMELHIVHYNTKYNGLGEAINKTDGLAVLGFMFEISNADNENYAGIVSALSQITTKDAEYAMTAKPLQEIIPSDLTQFYRYLGSLTTPTCDQSVTWTVFKNSIKISAAQLAEFRKLQGDTGAIIVNNYRPVQPLNNRAVQASFDPHVHWGYGSEAAKWPEYYSACGGQSQSPVDIKYPATEFEAIPNFQFNNYDTTTNLAMQLKNNGHSAVITYTSETKPAINEGGLPENYIAAQFHFHWGSVNSQGSEHGLNGGFYPAELHIVHYKASLGSLGSAVTVPEGLAVLGFFLEVTAADNPALQPLINRLPNVDTSGDTYDLPQAFSLDSFLPTDRVDFYRYSGSLTTPGCYESVIWTVFKNTIQISERQLTALRSLESDKLKTGSTTEYKPIVDNFRPVQPINQRIIKRTFTEVSASWDYSGSDGPGNWGQSFPACMDTPTSSQSPIDIVDTRAEYISLPALSMSASYNVPTDWELKNDGHGVKATLKSGQLEISNGGLSDTYQVLQFHFHWGSSNSMGSEHRLNGNAFPLELHIVHWGVNFPNVGTAVTTPNGLAVLGFFFEISENDNAMFAPIVNNLANIRNKDDKIDITAMNLRTLLPASLSDFYRYSGSLTTPGCYESVAWTVFRNTIKISNSQLSKFRTLLSGKPISATNNMTKPITLNYRPTQPLHGRIVRANFKLSPDSAVTSRPTMLLALAAVVVSLLTALKAL